MTTLVRKLTPKEENARQEASPAKPRAGSPCHQGDQERRVVMTRDARELARLIAGAMGALLWVLVVVAGVWVVMG